MEASVGDDPERHGRAHGLREQGADGVHGEVDAEVEGFAHAAVEVAGGARADEPDLEVGGQVRVVLGLALVVVVREVVGAEHARKG